MSKSVFRVTFEGDAFEQGEMDVRDLAPALLRMGEVVQAANRALNGTRAEARLSLSATNVGSFEALLSIDVSFLTAVADLLDAVADNPDRITAANELLDLLIKVGSIATVPVAGLFAVLKFLRRKRPDQLLPGPAGTTIVVGAGGQMVVDNRTVILLGDDATRLAVEEFGETALTIPGLTSLRLTDGDGQSTHLQRDDVEAFRVPLQVDEEIVLESRDREVWLRIVTSAFRDGYKWRFTDGGERPFTADILDVGFLNDVAVGRIALSANDTLRCQIHEEQRLSGKTLTKDVTVVRVLEFRPGDRQLKLL